MAKDSYTYLYGGNAGKKAQDKITLNDIRINTVNRSKKDIEGWRNAHKAAEVVGNPNRVRLYDLYDDVLLDGHLSGVIQKRIDQVLNKEVQYIGADGKRVDAMDALIRSSTFRGIMLAIMETTFWGTTGLEFVSGPELQYHQIPRKHIKPELGIISFEQNSTQGVAYADFPMVWVMGNPHDLGLLLKCAPYAIYKRDAMADWANYIEIFGQPVRVVKYDAYDEQTKIELKEVLDESGSSLALMIPKQAEFDMKDGKQSNGNGELQETFKNALNQEMSIIVVGNTETTTNGKTGSQAKSKVHSEQQNEIVKSDLYYTAYMLSEPRFQKILKSYGWPVQEGGRFQFKKDIDINYLSERITIDKEIATLGVPLDDDYFYNTYGIEKPANYDELKKKKAKQSTPPAPEDQPEPGKRKPAPGSKKKESKLRGLMNYLSDFFPDALD